MKDSWFRNPRPWHRTLPQSLDNPLQVDRLPDASEVELEYPVLQHTPAENRIHTFWVFLIAFFLGVLALVAQFFLSSFGGASYLQAALASVALLLFFTQVPLSHIGYRLTLCVLVWPIATALFFVFTERYFLIAIGMLAAAFLADRFASHFFYLKTAMPMPKSDATRLRRLWSRRFSPLFSTARGIELYWLSLLIVPGIYFFLLWCRQYFPDDALIPLVPTLFPALLALIFLPILIEALASFLTARRRLPLGLLFRTFPSAVVHWFSYNRENAQGAAVFRSPAGTHRQRRWMSLAVIAILTAGISQFLSIAPNVSTFRASEQEYPRETNEFVEPALSFSFHSNTSSLASTRLVSLVSNDASSDGLDLEPWQKGLLRRATEEERQRYLKRWHEQAEKAEREAASSSTPSADDTPSEKNPTAVLAGVSVFIVLYAILASSFPLLWFLATSFTTSASVVGFYAHHFSITSPEELLNPDSWSAVVNRLRASEDHHEKDSLFLGVNAYDGSPVIVPRSIFQEHAHLLGDSGSGKTSIGLAGLISQLIRFGDSSLVVIDLKADDLALFQNARVEARHLQMRLKTQDPEASYRFRWFTPEIDHSTYLFNPLTQEHFRSLTLYQRADVLTSAFGLRYGTDYGRSYFADANTQLLFEALQQCPNPSSFVELAGIVTNSDEISSKLRQDASHLLRVIDRLAACDPINVTNASKKHTKPLEHAIDFADVFRTPQAVFFHLPSAIGAVGTAEIARLALYSLLSAAKHVGPKRKQVYLLIDEFQIMAASNLEFILQTARSMNIAVILANQSLHNLETHGQSLIPTVRACTRFRQVFAASDFNDQHELIASSGETLVHSRAWSQYLGAMAGVAGGRSASASETVTPRLRANDILLATDHPRQSIVHIRRGDGYAQYGGMPFVMTSTHHVSYERFLKRKNSSWPKHRPGETLITELCMPKTGTQVPITIHSPEEAPDPVLESETPAAPETSSEPGSSETIDDLWRDHEKRKAKTAKKLARKKAPEPGPKPKESTDD